MDQRLKERLFGALIIVALFVIFLPMVLREPQVTYGLDIKSAPEISLSPEWLATPKELHKWQQEKLSLIKKDDQRKWAVQVATFANKANAISLVNKLKSKGFNAFLQSAPEQGVSVTWVLIGPDQEKSTAVELQKRLQMQFNVNALVVPYDPIFNS